MLNQPDAEKILAPYFPKLKECLDGGWEAWRDHCGHRRHILDARARAAIVYCEIADIAKRIFADLSDVRIVPKRNMCLVFFGEEILLRFKKLRNRKPRNVATRQQRLIELQQQGVFPGMKPNTFVTAGYQLDTLEQAIGQALVLAHFDGREVWAFDLNIGEGEADEGKVALMPSPEVPPTKQTRVKARKEEKKKRKAVVSGESDKR